MEWIIVIVVVTQVMRIAGIIEQYKTRLFFVKIKTGHRTTERPFLTSYLIIKTTLINRVKFSRHNTGTLRKEKQQRLGKTWKVASANQKKISQTNQQNICH